MATRKKIRYELSQDDIKTVRESSEYWDKHDVFEFGEPKEVKFDIRIRKSRYYVLLDNDIAREIGRVSRSKKQPVRVLVNQLLKQSLSHAA
jgi:hypothetical protein